MATVSQVVPRSGRGTELILLVPALAIGIYAYYQVGLAVDGATPANLWTFGGILTAVALAVHLVLRWRAPHADPLMLPIVVALNGIGLAMIARVHLGLAERENIPGWDVDPSRQLMWIGVGAVAAITVLILLRDHRTLRRYSWTMLILGFVLLVLPLAPVIGRTINGSRLWVAIGPLSFQPAELSKICFAVFFAGYLVTHRDQLTLAGRKVLGMTFPRLRDLAPILMAWALSMGVLLFQRELGTSILLFGLFIAMLYVATERLSWVLIGVALSVVGVAAVASNVGYVGARFDVWLRALDPEIYARDPGGSGQIVSGLFGMASGGLFGTGWGEGFPQLTYSANADMIVPSLAEELGLTGILALLMLYLVLAERGLRAAIGVRDGFGKLLGSGLAFILALQCFIVVGGATRVIPMSGLTMPFLAAGGSSLLANWIILALLLRLSDAARRPGTPDGELPVPDRPTRHRGCQVNAALRRVSAVVIVMFGVLMGALTWIQYVQAPALNADERNVRNTYREYGADRGPIIVAGAEVASSQEVDDPYQYLRTYSNGPLYAPVTGYSSVVFGTTGLERAGNEVLNGTAPALWRQRLGSLITGQQPQGGSIEVTINAAAQQAGYDGLAGRTGAVVALDPKTGAILAMVSSPSYDPNVLAGHDTAAVNAAWQELLAAEGDPLQNRAIAGDTYAPGSTFKLIDLAAILSTGNYTPDTRVAAPDLLDLPGSTATIQNPAGERCDDGETATLLLSLTKSCNTPFAALMMELGEDALREQAEAFGFGDEITVPQEVTPSRLGEIEGDAALAQTSIGQRDVRVTPLQMAMVAAGIANDGVVMAPYLVATERDANLQVVSETQPREYSTAVSPQVAETMTAMMVEVVANGTGTRAQIPGVSVAGKTGTAESGVDDGTAASNPHAWMVAFAPADDPQVAVAVLVANGGTPGQSEYTGGSLAGPIAADVMAAVLAGAS